MITKENAKKYIIVYESTPIDLSLAASHLKKEFDALYGTDTECVCDGSHRNAIIIGRSDSEGNKAPLMSYSIKSEGESIRLHCGGVYSAVCAADRLIRLLSEGCPEICVSEVLLSPDRLPLTEGSDLRVMTSNILAERWLCGGRPKIEIRAEIYAAHLAKYAPELVGVQETDMPWVEIFPAYLDVLRDEYGVDYSWDQNTVDDVANLTSILYQKKRFSMKEHGMRDFSYFTHVKYKLRVLTFAVFKDEQTGKTVALVNTHWSGNKENSVLEIKEENALVRDLEARYEGITVFCTGDFNMHGNFAFEPMKQGTGLVDAREAAEESGTLVNHLSGIKSDIYIDHVFFNTKMKVTRYETVDDPPAHLLSDHLPQYGDFTL